jgi:two-component system, cell cycle response regulator
MLARENPTEQLLRIFAQPPATRADLIERVLSLSLDLVGADGASLMANDARAIERWTLRRGEAAPLSDPIPRGSAKLARSILTGTMPLALPDLANSGRSGVEGVCAGVDAGPALFVPLSARGVVHGTLAAFRKRDEKQFTSDETRRLLMLGGWTSLALDNLKLRESVERLAVTDDLTQVYNYRFLKTALRRETRRAARYSQELALVMIDVDNLKGYNDRNGHMRGSMLLREIARLFTTQTRSWDLVAKYGGDEFTLILPQTGMEGACVVAERMRAAVENHTFALAERGSITISLGVAVFPHHGSDSISLIRAADRVLYQAKRSGRNRVATCEMKAA